jgi:hypothetical protein
MGTFLLRQWLQIMSNALRFGIFLMRRDQMVPSRAESSLTTLQYHISAASCFPPLHIRSSVLEISSHRVEPSSHQVQKLDMLLMRRCKSGAKPRVSSVSSFLLSSTLSSLCCCFLASQNSGMRSGVALQTLGLVVAFEVVASMLFTPDQICARFCIEVLMDEEVRHMLNVGLGRFRNSVSGSVLVNL